jgi:hypothetical protein
LLFSKEKWRVAERGMTETAERSVLIPTQLLGNSIVFFFSIRVGDWLLKWEYDVENRVDFETAHLALTLETLLIVTCSSFCATVFFFFFLNFNATQH